MSWINIIAGLGAYCFFGDLQKEIEISPSAEAGFEMPLSKFTEGYLTGSYSYLNLKRNKDFDGLHQFLGRAGLETSREFLDFASLGAGISLAFVRGKSASSNAEHYMLSDNESEFGWHILLNLRLLKIENFSFGARFYYDNIWTIPKNSAFASGGLFAGYLF